MEDKEVYKLAVRFVVSGAQRIIEVLLCLRRSDKNELFSLALEHKEKMAALTKYFCKCVNSPQWVGVYLADICPEASSKHFESILVSSSMRGLAKHSSELSAQINTDTHSFIGKIEEKAFGSLAVGTRVSNAVHFPINVNKRYPEAGQIYIAE